MTEAAEMAAKQSTENEHRGPRESERAPRLSQRALTLVLLFMCTVPVVTIAVLWSFMPPVYERQLKARVAGASLPDPAIYTLPYDERPPLSEEGLLVVTNTGDEDWTQYNIVINMQYAGSYQIYEHHVPIPAGETREFTLSSFVSRSGARFDLRYNPLKNVRIYARLPSAARATYYYSFEDESENE